MLIILIFSFKVFGHHSGAIYAYALYIRLCFITVSIGVLLELFCSIPDAYTAFVKQMESNLALAESREYCEMVSCVVILLSVNYFDFCFQSFWASF